MVRGKQNSITAQDQCFKSRGCAYKPFTIIIYATKGEITGMIAPAMVIVSIQVATEFAPEGCDYLVWRASQYFQNML